MVGIIVRKIRVLLGILFLCIGIGLISIPLYHEWKQAREVEALEEALALIASTDGPVDLSTIKNLPFTADEIEGVLELEIPSIDLKQKILLETSEKNLSVSLTQIKPNQTPGRGNFTIAGHRGYRGDRHFRNLPEVQIGEKVLLHTEEETFVYKVTSSDVIEPTDVEVLEDVEGKDEITLITCTVSGQQRIAIKGELIDIKERE